MPEAIKARLLPYDPSWLDAAAAERTDCRDGWIKRVEAEALRASGL